MSLSMDTNDRAMIQDSTTDDSKPPVVLEEPHTYFLVIPVVLMALYNGIRGSAVNASAVGLAFSSP